MTIVKGSTRWVFVAKKFVYKIPSLYSFKHFLLGLLANMQEVEFSKCKDFKETLCPIKFYFSLGFLVVMPKARILEPNEVSKDFLKEFLLVEEDEFQDEFHIYEDLISNQQLAESSVEDICNNANLLDLSEEMEELFVPFMTFFLQPNTNEATQQELIKFSSNNSFDVAVYTLITTFNKNR